MLATFLQTVTSQETFETNNNNNNNNNNKRNKLLKPISTMFT